MYYCFFILKMLAMKLQDNLGNNRQQNRLNFAILKYENLTFPCQLLPKYSGPVSVWFGNAVCRLI